MNTTPADDRVTQPGTAFTRRAMLRGLGITGMTAALAPVLLRSGPAQAAIPNRATRRAMTKPASGVARKKRKVGAVASSQPTPYLLQASSELSEEFFLTDQVKITSGDYVYPFVNPKNGNQVEAIVFASGTLSHLYRDTTSSTGWSFTAINLQGRLSAVNDVAIAANGTDVYLLAFGTPGDLNDDPYGDAAWLTTLDGPATWDTGSSLGYLDLQIDVTAVTGVIKGGVSRDGTPYFATTLTGGSTTIAGWTPTGDPDTPLAYQEFMELPADVTVVDFAVLFDDTGASTVAAPTGFLFVLKDDGTLSVYPQAGDSYDSTPMTNAGTTGVTELLWAWSSPTSTTHFPGYAYQTAKNGTGFVDENGNDNAVASSALKTTNAVSVWLQDGLYTVNLLDSDGTLQMIQELSSDGTGSWATPIPLVPDLQAVFGVPTDPNQNTLFAVGLDDYLRVLSLGPAGWTQSQVHQSGEELYDFSAYRVQGTVTDANGTAVPGAQVTISTDRPVGGWTPTGSLAITPDAPLTVTADVKGEITFSIPADELDCAMLTMQALDDSNNPTGTALVVTADNDVRAFLGGTAALGDLGSLSGGALTSATNSDGTPLFPSLTDPDSANASAQALNQLIKAGTDAQNNTTTAQAFTLNVNGGKPTYTPGAPQARLQGTRLTFSFGHLFDSIGHAIRHGAAKLAQAVIRAAENAAGWVVDLALEIEGAIVTFTDLAIADMKSAFHVIGGFFATLGADIESAVAWLKTNVLGLIEAAKAAAAQFQTWIADLGTNLTSALTKIELSGNTWFSEKEAEAHTAISDLEKLATGTLGGPDLPPASDTGSASNQSHLGKDLSYLGKVMNDAPGKWLLHKLLSYLPVTDTGPSISSDTYQPILQALSTDWTDAMTFSDELFDFIKTSMSLAFSSGTSADGNAFKGTKVSDWFADLDNVVEGGLNLLDALADTLLDLCITGVALIEDYFTYQYNLVSSMGILGYILEKAGVDIHFSLSEILSWTVAFPATLIAKCRGYNALFPAAVGAAGTTNAKLGGQDPDGWQLGLGISGAVAQGVWGMADLVGDLQVFYDEDSGTRGTASGVIDYFDILCPLVETIVLWPSEPNADGSQGYPFQGGLATKTKDYLLLPFVIATAILPSLFQAVSKAPWTASVVGKLFPKDVQDVVRDYMNPFVQMIGGIANTVLGATYSGVNNAGTSAILGTVLGNLSYIGAPLATKVMNATTDDVSTLVKMLIDAGGNIGAAVCIAEATSLPTP